MTWLVNTFRAIFSLDWITALLDWCADLFETAWLMVVDGVVWTVDSLLGIATGIVENIPAPTVPPAQLFGNIPPEVLDMATRVGLIPAMAMIVPCIIIRIGLQLIPFVRLGS